MNQGAVSRYVAQDFWLDSSKTTDNWFIDATTEMVQLRDMDIYVKPIH